MNARVSARLRLLLLVSVALMGVALPVRADSEAPDPTRLDVERLPPEAIAVTRDMYATGWFAAAELGGQGIAGGAGRLALAGPYARLGVGYELTPWFSLASTVDLSFHTTDAPAPPAVSAFQLYHVLLQAKLQLPVSVRSALWLAADGGLGWASGDFLEAWGLRHAGTASFNYGGDLGFDWHLMNTHHSLGLSAGALLQPNLDRPGGDRAIVIHGSAYLKYVF